MGRVQAGAVLEVRELEKHYGAVRAISGLGFTVGAGEILGLVGPNGAGKTTTLRCLAGVLRPTSGSVRIAGHDLATEPVAAKRCLAFLPDEPKLFDHLTVEDHLNFMARLHGVEGWRAKARALFEELELEGKRDAIPAELSRGMKQKLVIACGLLHEPKLVILDEPLTGLDPLAIRKMKASLRRRADAGAAILLSSHLMPLVEELCDRVLVVAGGRPRALGTVDEIRATIHMRAGEDKLSLEELFVRVTAAGDAEPPSGETH